MHHFSIIVSITLSLCARVFIAGDTTIDIMDVLLGPGAIQIFIGVLVQTIICGPNLDTTIDIMDVLLGPGTIQISIGVVLVQTIICGPNLWAIVIIVGHVMIHRWKHS
jgi:hypothetical protein